MLPAPDCFRTLVLFDQKHIPQSKSSFSPHLSIHPLAVSTKRHYSILKLSTPNFHLIIHLSTLTPQRQKKHITPRRCNYRSSPKKASRTLQSSDASSSSTSMSAAARRGAVAAGGGAVVA